jgi:hypothetical protein
MLKRSLYSPTFHASLILFFSGIELVHDVAERGKIIVALGAVHTVINAAND